MRDRRPHAGFGLLDLMISTLVMSVLLVGFYKFAASSTRLTYLAASQTKVSDSGRALRHRLTAMFRNMGLNEELRPYPLCSGTSPGCDPSANLHRFGISEAMFSEIEYASDDDKNETVDSNKEIHRLFVAQDENSSPLSFEGLTDPTKEPCTPRSGTVFTETYRLYERVGSDVRVLADHVLCFELRYLRDGDTATEKRWQPVCPPTTDPSNNCPPALYLAGDFLQDPVTPGTQQERDHYDLITRIRKVQVGLKILGPEGAKFAAAGVKDPGAEQVVFDSKLGNPPWIPWAFDSKI
jgi:hypothetical protein